MNLCGKAEDKGSAAYYFSSTFLEAIENKKSSMGYFCFD
jgi:hypothetical protein